MTDGGNQFQDYRRFLDLTSQSPPLSDVDFKNFIRERKSLNLLLSQKLNTLKIPDMVRFDQIYILAMNDGKNPRQFKLQWNITPKKIRKVGPELIKIKNQVSDIDRKLISSCSRLILSIAKQYYPNRNCSMEEILHEGVKGCAMALANFDPERGVQFQTFASPSIRVRMSRILKKTRYDLIETEMAEEKNEDGEMAHLNPDEIFIYYDNTENRFWHKEVMKLIMPYIELLPERQREIIKLLFGLDGNENESQIFIGKKMGIKNPQFVYQLKEEGLEKLRSILPPKLRNEIREEFLTSD